MADRCVGGDHEGLDHPRRLVGPLDLHTQLVFAVEAWAKLGVVEVEANLSVLPRSGQSEHVVVGVGLEHVVVGDVVLDVNHGFVGVGVHDVVPVVEVHADDHGQAVHTGPQRTEVVGQFGWQHRKHGVGQIDGGRPSGRRTVERGAGLHVVRHVGDGHPQRSLAVVVHEAHGVVEVFGVGRVDGHQRKVAQIGASSSDFLVAGHLAQGVGVVHQRGVVGAREGVAVLATAPLQASIEQFSGRPAPGLHQQQGHRRLIVSEAKA